MAIDDVANQKDTSSGQESEQENQYPLEDFEYFLTHELEPYRNSTAKELCKTVNRIAKYWEATVFASEHEVHIFEGPCIWCATPIKYGTSGMHRRLGDRFLRKIFDREVTAEFSHCFSRAAHIEGIQVRGINSHVWKHYICGECKEFLLNEYTKRIQAWGKEQLEHAKQNQLEKHEFTQWLCSEPEPGEILSYRTYWADVHYNVDVETIKSLPYSRFLKSRYWIMIRKYVLKQAGYRCQLCHAHGVELHVHHKTYEHHGREWKYLEDLTVLCNKCHGKFHDKLPAPPQDESR